MYTHMVYMLMIDAEGTKNVASKVIQSNTAHPRQSLFQGKMAASSCGYYLKFHCFSFHVPSALACVVLPCWPTLMHLYMYMYK